MTTMYIVKYMYFECTKQYYTLVLCYHKGDSHTTMITVQSSTIVLLRSTVDYHLIKV